MSSIKVYECSGCQQRFVQRKWICPKCKGTEFVMKDVEGKGKVYSHTTIHVSSKEFAGLTPYTIALIELKDQLRVTGRVQDRVEIGEEVACVSSDENYYLFAKK